MGSHMSGVKSAVLCRSSSALLRDSQGDCGACRRKWRLTDTDLCPCLPLSNPVPWLNWMAVDVGYTLRMKTLFRDWPAMVHDTHTRRRSALVHAWRSEKYKSPASWQMSGSNCLRHHSNMQHLLSLLAAWKTHQCTSAWRHWLKPTRRNMFIRNQWGTSISWNAIWSKCGQQPAELHWSSDWTVAGLF